MVNWLVENWYFVYLPVHIVIGVISWAWFYYSDTEKIKEEYQTSGFSYPVLSRFVGLSAGVIMGPFIFLSIILDHFQGMRKLRYGLRFF